MKTNIKNGILLACGLFAITFSTLAQTPADPTNGVFEYPFPEKASLVATAAGSGAKILAKHPVSGTSEKAIKNVQHLVVRGKVTVFLLQDEKEEVRFYDKTAAAAVQVKQEGNILTITGTSDRPARVGVYVRNLNLLEASGQSEVRSFGKMAFLGLDLRLRDQAKADINAQMVSLYVNLKDDSSLNLRGSAQEHVAVLGAFSRLDMQGFNAGSSSVLSQPAVLLSRAY